MMAQVKALAHAIGVVPLMKQVTIKKPFALMPNVMLAPIRSCIVPGLIDAASDSLEGPYPGLVITCGRRAALVAMGIKAKSPATKVVHIQDPQCNPKYFDLVVAMQHDAATGTNVIKTRFALHSITPDVLAQARGEFEKTFSAFAAPRVAVLLGGSTNKYQLNAQGMQRVIDSLQTLLGATKCSLLITPSRRTGEANIRKLREVFAKETRVYIYDFASQNPYMGMLALADAIVATNDSVNMMSEAMATGKPLYLLPLMGHEGTKPAMFAESLMRDGIANPLGATLGEWSYPQSDEMAEIGRNVKARLGL